MIVAAALAVVCACQSGLAQQNRQEEFPALAWITALEQKDTGAIKAELNARDEAERQQEAQEAQEAESQDGAAGQAGDGGQTGWIE